MAVKVIQPSGFQTSYFSAGSAPSPSTPVAFFVQFNPNALPGSLGSTLAYVGNMPPGFGGREGYVFGVRASPDLRVFVTTRHFIFNTSGLSSGQVSIGAWQTAGARIPTQSNRRVYLDGTWGTVDTGDVGVPTGFEDVIIGAQPTSTVGTFNGGYSGCLYKLCIWQGTIPAESDFDLMRAGTDPKTISPEGIFRFVLFDEEGNATECYAWDGAAVSLTTALTFTTDEGSGGGYETCEDSPEEPPPEPEPAEGCETEDEADEQPAADVTWPECDLVPTSIDVQIVSPTASPGRSLSGREQVVQADAGHIRVELIEIPVWTETLVLLWRDLESTLNGRNGTVLVPLYEAKLSDTPIAATVAEDRAIGAVRLKVDQTAGADIRKGMWFQVGERAYMLKRVIGEDGDGFIDVMIQPPLRELITTGETLNFNDPKCRCRLERDNSMALDLELLQFGKPSVAFVEDV